MNDKKRNEEIYELAMFYYRKQVPVHISLISGRFYNGTIISINQDYKDRLVLLDQKAGEILIYFDRIIDDGIEPKIEEVGG